jgi:hypothetical protein
LKVGVAWAVAILFSLTLNAFAFDAQTIFVAGNTGENHGSLGGLIRQESLNNMTLAEVMRSIGDSVDWESAVYPGLLFGKKTKADLETLIDSLATDKDWLGVLKWTAICRKFEIERETAIKAALDNLQMIGPLPRTVDNSETDYFCVEDSYALFGYYYAEKYSYRLDKWNITEGYNFFKNAIDNNGKPVLFIDENCDSWTKEYGPRYYDESACSIQCFLVFFELGIKSAIDEALRLWAWVNNNLWYEGTHYKYALNWANYECEAGFFAKIIAHLRYYEADLGNWSRVIADLQNRFLADKWNSKQWFAVRDFWNGTSYAVVHHYPSNPQTRLGCTIGAWTALQSLYGSFDNVSQSAMQDMLLGYDNLNAAWAQLMSPFSELYDSGMFKWSSDSISSSEATAYALNLVFFLGIIPQTTVLAFPLEEYSYEYLYDVDPELYSIDLENNSVRVSVMQGGELEFIYGSSPVCCSFPSKGVYSIVFQNDWNSVVSISRIHDLPSNRRYVRPGNNIAIVGIKLNMANPKTDQEALIQVSVANVGNFTEMCDLCIECTCPLANFTDTQTITLISMMNETLTFIWIPKNMGAYTIRAFKNTTDYGSNAENEVKTITVYIIDVEYLENQVRISKYRNGLTGKYCLYPLPA